MQLFVKNKRAFIVLFYCLIFAFPRFIGSQTIPIDTKPIKILGLGSVRVLAFSPDGKKLYIGSLNRVKLVDIKTSETIRTFNGHNNDINSISLSADGKRMVTASEDGTVKLWNTSTGRELKTFIGKPYSESSDAVAVISPNGKKVLTANLYQYKLNLWDAVSGVEIYSFTTTDRFTGCLQFSPDGNYLLMEDGNNVKLFNMNTYQLIRTFSGHTSGISFIKFSWDGSKFLTGSYDNTAKLWDINTGLNIRTFTHSTDVYSGAFMPDGNYIVTVTRDSNDKIIRCWDINTGKVIHSFEGSDYALSYVDSSPLGRIIATVSNDEVRLWDIYMEQEIGRIGENHYGLSPKPAFSPDGKRAVTGGNNYKLSFTAIVWDLECDHEIFRLRGHKNKINSIAYSSDGRRILTGSSDKTAKLWDADTGEEIRTFQGHTDIVTSVAFSTSGTLALTASYDKTAKLWNYITGDELVTYVGHVGSINHAVFSPDNKEILTGSNDRTARLWEAQTGKELSVFSFSYDYEGIIGVAFTPDGQNILTGTNYEDEWAHPPCLVCVGRLWDKKTGIPICDYRDGGLELWDISLSPDGRSIIVCGFRNYPHWDIISWITIFDLHSEKKVKSFSDYCSILGSVVYSPDGSKFFSSSSDGSNRLWHVNPPPPTPTPTPIPSLEEVIGYILNKNGIKNGDTNSDDIIDSADAVTIIIKEQ